MTRGLPAASRSFQLGDEVGDAEARLVTAALLRAGWVRAGTCAPALLWGRPRQVDAAAEAVREAGTAHLARIPGFGLLRRRDVVTAALRRLRARRGDSGPECVGLLDTFAMPDDRERLDAVRAAEPGRRWLQRPAAATAGDPRFSLADHEAEQRPEWVVQPVVDQPVLDQPVAEQHNGPAPPVVVRALAVMASLEPLVVYALPGVLHELRGPAPHPAGGHRTLLIAPAHCPPGTAVLPRADLARPGDVTDLVLSAVAEVCIATRELLLREYRHSAQAASRPFQLFGISTLLDRHLRPWLLEVETEPLAEWSLPLPVADALLDGVAELLAAAGRPAPEQAGPLLRSVPGRPARMPGADWALPRPADLKLAAALAGHQHLPAERSLRPAGGVRWWRVGTELVLYLPEAGDLVVLNGTGAFTWVALADGLPAGTIAAELATLGHHPPEWWQAAVRDVLAEWVEVGAVGPDGTRQAPPARHQSQVPSPPMRVTPVRWNPDHVYTCQGSSILTRLPSRELASWVDRALVGLRDPDPAEIAAVVEVSADGHGWWLTGTHVAPRRHPSVYHLPSAVRAAVLDSAARTSDHPAFHGSALLADETVTVVVGPASARADVLNAWVASGGRILADEIVGIDDDLAVRPELAGLELAPAYQWLDGPPAPWPSPAAPVVDGQGNLVRYRFPAAATVAAGAAPATALIVPGKPPSEPLRACSPGMAVATLAAGRTLGRQGFTERQAARLVAWAAAVTPWQASLDDPGRLVAAIHAQVRPTAGPEQPCPARCLGSGA